MIEETARVVAIDGEFALVETQRKSACDSCSVKKGCGTGALSKVVGKRANRFRVLNCISARVHDRVVVGIEEQALVRGSLALYAVPIVTMLVAALFAQWFFSHAEGEGWVILSALVGLAVGFAWVNAYSRRVAVDPDYQPVVLRLADAGASSLECER